MKTRKGFVSNSSTSSFICDSCGGAESGMDLGLMDAGMFECGNGHTIHEDCAPNFTPLEEPEEDDFDTPQEYTKAYEAYESNGGEDWRYEGYDGIGCPLCSLTELNSDIKASYLMALHGYTEESLLKKISAFVTLNKLNKEISRLNENA